MIKKIIVIEMDHGFISRFKGIIESVGAKNEYEVVTPSFDGLPDNDEILIVDHLVTGTSTIVQKHMDSIAGILVDIRIIEGSEDILGIDIAYKLKDLFPQIPVINITHHYKGDDIVLFGEVSLGNVDGILPKSYFRPNTFTKKKLNGMFDIVKQKLEKRHRGSSTRTSEIDNRLVKADVAVITALNNPEFSALKKIYTLKKIPDQNLRFADTSHYYNCEIKKGDKTLTIVAATDDTMGMSATTSLATRIIQQFDPKYIVILGICAGIEGDTNIGDILVAEHSYDYGSGKNTVDIVDGVRHERFVPYHQPYRMDAKLRKGISAMKNDDGLFAAIRSKSSDFSENDKKLNLLVGPFASGAAVIANKDIVADLKTHEGKLIGFDMETYGVFYAAENSNDKTKAISIKAVSDFGTESKNTSLKHAHQLYAATNSVLFFKYVLDKVLLGYLKPDR